MGSVARCISKPISSLSPGCQVGSRVRQVLGAENRFCGTPFSGKDFVAYTIFPRRSVRCPAWLSWGTRKECAKAEPAFRILAAPPNLAVVYYQPDASPGSF